MEMTASERQQQFLKLAATHAEDFKTRVVQHDRENSFPFENVEALKASGYTNLTVPVELGGGGATPGEWPGFIQAASANSDSARGTASIGGDRCPRLTHCWVSQVLQS